MCVRFFFSSFKNIKFIFSRLCAHCYLFQCRVCGDHFFNSICLSLCRFEKPHLIQFSDNGYPMSGSIRYLLFPSCFNTHCGCCGDSILFSVWSRIGKWININLYEAGMYSNFIELNLVCTYYTHVESCTLAYYLPSGERVSERARHHKMLSKRKGENNELNHTSSNQ